MKALLLDDPLRLRNHLMRARRVLQPQTDAGNVVHWTEVSGERTPFASDLPLPQFSSKQFFFPERETLFRFEGGAFVETLPETPPFALFGVRACDLTAIAYQDRFFKDDPYYQTRRAAALLVGIDCVDPCTKGFCPEVDAGPCVRAETADLVLHPLLESEQWLLIAMSEQGERALDGLSLSPAPSDWREKRAKRERETAARFPDTSHIREGARRLNAGEVSAATWESIGIQCFACSGCTSLCPTCSCFATYERPAETPAKTAGAFERERCWDSCLYEGFQKEASGHNPAFTPGQRVERYWYHKFSDDYLPEFGRYGCVGCGRCETTCLGVIGVHSVMRRLAGR